MKIQQIRNATFLIDPMLADQAFIPAWPARPTAT